ncbi:hypothetical protein NQ318_006864 [Aromia moschata]|uniref:Uncharacterized protein n=1 Tax=Aromia moschata TaxID=1265417 RepID=A0AAV8YI99_9CUCU|nr:hypothetical protein NQ318_006864 [Aromia moschata]
MYQFVEYRFQKTGAKVQEQVLHWLQTLTLLEKIIPYIFCFHYSGEGVSYMKDGPAESDGGMIKCTDLEMPWTHRATPKARFDLKLQYWQPFSKRQN